MNILEILRDRNIINDPEKNNAKVRLQISDGNRNEKAATKRFFISYNDKDVFSIKKIPAKGIYNIELILSTQRYFSTLPHSTSPNIIDYFEDKGYFFIVEEAIENSFSIKEAINNNIISHDNGYEILNKIINSLIFNSNNLRISEGIVEREINEIIEGINILSLEEETTLALKEKINQHLEVLSFPCILTNRDLNFNNILISTNKNPVVIDFDLSRKTCFPWLDLYRSNLIITESFDIKMSNAPYEYFLKRGLDENLLQLMTLLYEINLQKKVLTNTSFEDIKVIYFEKSLLLIDEIFDTNYKKRLQRNKMESRIINYNNNIQVFYGENYSFNEEQSVQLPTSTGESKNRYLLKIRNNNTKLNNIDSVRIDPANSPSFIELYNIRIFGKKNEEEIKLFEMDDYEQLIIKNAITIPEYNDKLAFFCYNSDPQIIINRDIPLAEFNEVFIEIIMNYSNLNQTLASVLTNQFLKYNSLKEELVSNRKELSKLQDDLKTEANNITALQEQILRREQVIEALQEQVAGREQEIKALQEQLGGSEQEIKALQEQIAGREQEIATLQYNLYLKENEIDNLVREIGNILNSKSWKLTAPLRWIKKKVIR